MTAFKSVDTHGAGPPIQVPADELEEVMTDEHPSPMENDIPMPDRKKLEQAIKATEFAERNSTPNALGRGLRDDEIKELLEGARWALHAIPKELDFVDLCSQNPINQVYFRAGLLACREYMARFVEQGGDKTTAASIRANWWPQLGIDPGAPRLFQFDEIADEKDGGGISSKPISASVEALPRAYQFLLPSAPNQDRQP